MSFLAAANSRTMFHHTQLRRKSIMRLNKLVIGLGTVCLAVATVAPAMATSVSLPAVVTATPATFTPQVDDSAAVSHSAVYAVEPSPDGTTMFTGGDFTQVADKNDANPVTRTDVFSFSASTGALTTFAPVLDGPVWAIAFSGADVYVAGSFTHVNGQARRGIAELDASTGALIPAFNAGLKTGGVTQVRLVANRLIIGGDFANKLLAIDPVTGADTGYIEIPITGQVAANTGNANVYRFAVSPDGTRLVAIGNFTTVGTSTRWRAFMLDLGPTTTTLDPWYYQNLVNHCKARTESANLRDVDFAPDGSYFVLVATGYLPLNPGDICDAAAKFSTTATAPYAPDWINYTGGDTFHSVAVTTSAVYVQGHFRWLDNPGGNDSCGPGCQPRMGIGAIDPTSGQALSWNPGKTRGVGGKDLTITPQGLWVGSDGARIAGKQHKDLALMPE